MLRHRLGELTRLLTHVLALRLVRPADAFEHLAKCRHPACAREPRIAREVRAAVERSQRVGFEKHAHGPAAMPAHRDGRGHVQLIEVGSLLAVELDAHEQLVHDRRSFVMLEALPFHDVAPVAGAVADGQKDRHFTPTRLRERFLAPGAPCDGVVRVLQQVRAGGVDQVVGLATGGRAGHGGLGGVEEK